MTGTVEFQKRCNMTLPVEVISDVPKPGDAGFFGAVRKYDIHTGIDLYTEDGACVHAIRSGTVVNIEEFTGPAAGSDWWEDTKAILVEDLEGVILYGELYPLRGLEVGDVVKPGELIGHVKRVLKVDKGKNSTSMLHLEYYARGTRHSVWWEKGSLMPENLRDPMELLK